MTHVFDCSQTTSQPTSMPVRLFKSKCMMAPCILYTSICGQLMSAQRKYFCAFYKIFQAEVGYENVSDIPVCIQETVLVGCEDLATRPRAFVWRIAHGGRMLRQ